MELKEIQHNTEKKEIGMSIRCSKSNSKWMKENKVSPQKLFDKALEEIKEKSK